MGKYQIDRSFFPFSMFSPPMNGAVFAMARVFLQPSLFMGRHKGVQVDRRRITVSDGSDIELLIYTPENLPADAPCLVYYHGGGFVFDAAPYHYQLAYTYAKTVPCKVVMVRYRLVPKVVFPVPLQDCLDAFLWVHKNAQALGIDVSRIAVGGDSAGGALAAGVAQTATKRNIPVLAQFLVYPACDRSMNTQSNRMFTDTPMWNSTLSKKMWKIYVPDGNGSADCGPAAPAEATELDGLPTAYVETAEFDCLRDEGLDYAQRLQQCGCKVTVQQTKGTMHGFDICMKAPETVRAIACRVQFLQKCFYQK